MGEWFYVVGLVLFVLNVASALVNEKAFLRIVNTVVAASMAPALLVHYLEKI